jgi:hypothetical protein
MFQGWQQYGDRYKLWLFPIAHRGWNGSTPYTWFESATKLELFKDGKAAGEIVQLAGVGFGGKNPPEDSIKIVAGGRPVRLLSVSPVKREGFGRYYRTWSYLLEATDGRKE